MLAGEKTPPHTGGTKPASASNHPTSTAKKKAAFAGLGFGVTKRRALRGCRCRRPPGTESSGCPTLRASIRSATPRAPRPGARSRRHPPTPRPLRRTPPAIVRRARDLHRAWRQGRTGPQTRQHRRGSGGGAGRQLPVVAPGRDRRASRGAHHRPRQRAGAPAGGRVRALCTQSLQLRAAVRRRRERRHRIRLERRARDRHRPHAGRERRPPWRTLP